MKTNIHIYPTDLTNETRIIKITDWLVNHRVFDRIIVAGVASPRFSGLQRKGKRKIYVRLSRGNADNSFWPLKAAQFFLLYLNILTLIRRTRPVCISAHSLSVLPAAVLGKWLYGAKLVYDTHELETEVYTAVGLRKKCIKITERLLVRFADQIVVVSGGIADWYEKTYDIPKPSVLRNVPDAPIQQERGDYLRKYFKLPEESIIALYLGALAKGRDVGEIIEAWNTAPPSWHLVIVGFGPLLQTYKELTGGIKNIHFHAPVPMNEIVPLAASANIGLCFFDPACLSHYYSLPNKFFECLCAGVPVVSNDLPERRKIIEEEDAGWIISTDRITDIFALKREEIDGKAPAARRTAQRCQWATETLILENVYEALGFFTKKPF